MNRLSKFLRHKIEGTTISELIGIPLTALVFIAAILVPETIAGFDSAEVYFDTGITTINVVVAPSRFRWPLASFGFSQGFFGGHQGLDLTNPAGTPVYPVSEGKVVHAANTYTGYGKHVIVKHDNAMTSTYAHLSVIRVKTGDRVTKETELGAVGSTGWATGNHLHLEIHQNGISLNPMEVLPQIKPSQSKAISQIEASTPLPYLSL